VASSDGRIWSIDWTTGQGVDSPYIILAKKILDFTVSMIRIGESLEEVLLVLEKHSHGVAKLMAYDRDALASQNGIALHKCEDWPHMLRSVDDPSVIVIVTKSSIQVGASIRKGAGVKALGDLLYQFVSFDVEDQITSIDLKQTSQTTGKSKESRLGLVVGGARGVVLVYGDLLANLPAISGAGASRRKASMQIRTLHWHRRAVHSVKWSLDGKACLLVC
jgi:NET1-associated nuclear protein 1 (U3 small nucleolar RNA-associated protein 17)